METPKPGTAWPKYSGAKHTPPKPRKAKTSTKKGPTHYNAGDPGMEIVAPTRGQWPWVDH